MEREDNEHTSYGAINDTEDPDAPLLSVLASRKQDIKSTPSKTSIVVVWVLFLILGIGTLLPWNLFITANNYFIRKSGLSNFESYLVLVAQTPNVIFFFLTLVFKEFLRASPRVYSSLFIMLVLFLVTIAFTEIYISEVVFTVITFICVAVINAVSGLYQTTVIGISGVFPSINTQAVMVGQGVGGILPPTILVLTKLIVIQFGISIDSSYFLNTSACVYFSFASISILVCIVAYLALTHFPYSKQRMTQLPQPRKLVFLTRLLHEIRLVARHIWLDCFNVFYVFFITLSVFPALTSSILPQAKVNFTTLNGDACICPGDQMNATKVNMTILTPPFCSNWVCLYFTPLFCFLAFNLFDFIGRIAAGFTAKLRTPSVVIAILSLVRTIFIPLILLCNVSDKRFFPYWFPNDYIYLCIMILIGITNGTLSSISMMKGPQKAPEEYRETAAILMALALGVGLFMGSILSLILAKIFIM